MARSCIGLLLAILVLPAAAQDRGNTLPRVSPNATVSQTIGVTEVRMTYGRPRVDGRTIFGDLVPYGEPWRTGANEATTFSVSTPVQIEGDTLAAGTYGLFTVPGPNSWTLIFNDVAEQWGAYEYDPTEDVLRVQASPEPADAQELLTFAFENVTDTSATAVLHWATTRVPFDLTVNTTDVIRRQAAEAVSAADSWQTPARYAAYALEHDVLLTDALAWIDRSIALDERFANVALKARLQAAQGQYGPAVETATAALTLAEGVEEKPSGVDELRTQIENWKAQL
jgi:hypothetical protein